jgi:translation initiation factor 3 subunit L
MLGRYPDAIRTYVAILNLIMRMRQYHTRSYQYDQVRIISNNPFDTCANLVQINKTADRMYALFAICTALSPSRLDDNIANTVKERYGEQFTKMSRGYVSHNIYR